MFSRVASRWSARTALLEKLAREGKTFGQWQAGQTR